MVKEEIESSRFRRFANNVDGSLTWLDRTHFGQSDHLDWFTEQIGQCCSNNLFIRNQKTIEVFLLKREELGDVRLDG